MKSFQCQVCGQLIFFENARCLRCSSTLGYLPDHYTLCALEPAGPDHQWRPLLPEAHGTAYRLCRNSIEWQACNWMVPESSQSDYCLSCILNKTIPDLSDPANMDYWRKLEQGKRRLIYGLTRLGLPVFSTSRDTHRGLAFEFLKETRTHVLDENDVRVMTGHNNGLITVNVAEADDLERERIRLNLNEVYRSLLGHFRHESGHYYWQRLVKDTRYLPQFRQLFGDETVDYESSINRYYEAGPVPDWASSFVSAYASSHPWEDWAECWTHYLTIVDALETADDFGVVVSQNHVGALFPRVDSYRANTFAEMLDQWLPLTYAVNSINRSGGQNDLYPFVLPGPAIDKLEFIHQVIKDTREGG